MKTGIKIFLIAIVVIGIAIAIYYYCSEIIIKEPDPIKTTPFIEYVQERVKNEIVNKNISEARNAFNDIMGEISTEASVTLNNDKKLLSDNEVEKSKLLAFDAYAPIFVENAIAYFKQSSWSDYVLNSNKKEAQKLLDMKIAEPETQIDNSLDTVIKTVKNYNAAWEEVVKVAKYCSTVAGIKNLKKDADDYKKKPYLSNNGDLMKALDSVESTAKDAVINHIYNQCEKLKKDYEKGEFSNYQEFYDSYNKCSDMIDEYYKDYNLSLPQKLQNARRLIDDTDTEADTYFNQRKDDN